MCYGVGAPPATAMEHMTTTKEQPTFSQLLGQYMRAGRWSDPRLAKAVGVSRAAVQKWRRGQAHPDTPARLGKLIDALSLAPGAKVALRDAAMRGRDADVAGHHEARIAELEARIA